MKNYIKKLAVIFMICFLVSSSLYVFADEKPLYEKFGYDSNFEYEDEYIAHALKSSVVLIMLNYEATVEYKPVTFDVDTVVKYVEDLHKKYSSEYTVEEVSDLVVQDMQKNLAAYLEWGKAKSVDVEATWQGSGVVIDEFGYIATNSHVVSLTKEAKLEACMNHLQAGIIEDLEKVIEDVDEIDISLTEEQLQELLETVVNETAQEASIEDEKSSLFVCFPSSSGDTDLDKERIYEAEVVAEGVSLEVSKDGTTQDAAILEISKEGLVALNLSTSYPEVNSKIVSAGFPVAADVAFQSTGSAKSILSVSVNKGEVTRHIPIEGSDYKAMEISTIISGGNSGGPSVDKNLNIEGLNTYTSVEDNRYGYMIPAEYVSELAEEFEIGQGEVSITFLTGIQMLQQGYGGAALECFNKAQSLNEDIPYIENLVSLAQNQAQDYPSGVSSSHKSGSAKYVINYKLIAVIAVAVIVVAAVVVLIIVKSKKKNKVAPAENFERFNVFNSFENTSPDNDSVHKPVNSGTSNQFNDNTDNTNNQNNKNYFKNNNQL